MKFYDYLDKFQETLEWIKRKQKINPKPLDYWKGFLKGYIKLLTEIILTLHPSEYPTLEPLTEEEIKVYSTDDPYLSPEFKINIIDDIIVYLDDYGQCFSIKDGDTFVGLGTYNMSPQVDIFYLVVNKKIYNFIAELEKEE